MITAIAGLQQETILGEGLVMNIDVNDRACYKGNGTDIKDLSNSLDGELVNGPSLSTFNTGRYIDFDGTNDYLDSGFEPTNANSQNGYAWCYWFNFDDLGTQGLNGFRSGAAGRVYTGHVDNGNMFVGCGDKYNLNLTGGTAFTIETWTYVVNTYDGNGTCYFYLNAVQVGTITGITFSIDGSDGNLVLGQLNNNATIDGTYASNGKGGVAHYYSRHLSAAEVLHNFNAQRHRFGV